MRLRVERGIDAKIIYLLSYSMADPRGQMASPCLCSLYCYDTLKYFTNEPLTRNGQLMKVIKTAVNNVRMEQMRKCKRWEDSLASWLLEEVGGPKAQKYF